MMSPRTLAAVLLVAALCVGAYLLGAMTSAPPAPQRDLHSERPRSVPAMTVAVTAGGKLFHTAACPFLHGPATAEPAREAMQQGYTACVRCLKGLSSRR
ncbi:MAG TPA: hypothetical protein VGN09_02285 [Vicinamibacteria bacterium]|jgi:hypothetical protein